MQLNQLKEKIKSDIPISVVVKKDLQLSTDNSNFKCRCPFHNGDGNGAFSVSSSRAMFKCFKCGVSGDMFKYVSLRKNITYNQAILLIGRDYGFITEHEYNSKFEIYANKNITDGSIEVDESESNLHYQTQRQLDIDKAPINILDRVYRCFLQGNSYLSGERLSEEHKNLLLSRGLNSFDIKNGEYTSMPSRAIMPNFTKELAQKNLLQFLKYVPGFYYDLYSREFTFNKKGESILIPIKNVYNQIEALQIRTDVKSGKNRYFFLSSKNPVYEEPDWLIGASCGTPVAVIHPTDHNRNINTTIMATEGVFKAISLSKKFNSVVISVQGVGNWKDVSKTIFEVISYYRPYVVFDKFMLFYDSDISFNLSIINHSKNLCASVATILPTYLGIWHTNLGKGIDDFLQSGEDIKNIHVLTLNDFNNFINNFYMYLSSHYPMISIDTIPIELLQQAFYQVFYSISYPTL